MDISEQCRIQGTWNIVQQGWQETVQDAGKMEQSTLRLPGNSAGCNEHGTE